MINWKWIHEKKYQGKKPISAKMLALSVLPVTNSMAIIAILISITIIRILILIPVTNSTAIIAIRLPITIILILIPVTNSTAILYTVKKQY